MTPEAFTRGIRVQVESQYRPEYSAPAFRRWFFAYRIRIANEGNETVQLISRHWEITDAHGQVRYVSGLGVVGQQPILEPGAVFEYTSACPLGTPFGAMQGSYRLTTAVGDTFDAVIPEFSLHMPGAIN